MPIFYPIEQGGTVNTARRPVDGGAIRQISSIRRSWTLAAQTTSDTLEGLTLPRGFKPIRCNIWPSVTLGSSTLAIGIAGTTGKYRAAATVTTPASAVVLIGTSVALAADEPILVTIGAASLPASGTVQLEFEGTYE
jgi:hypothetical protein